MTCHDYRFFLEISLITCHKSFKLHVAMLTCDVPLPCIAWHRQVQYTRQANFCQIQQRWQDTLQGYIYRTLIYKYTNYYFSCSEISTTTKNTMIVILFLQSMLNKYFYQHWIVTYLTKLCLLVFRVMYWSNFVTRKHKSSRESTKYIKWPSKMFSTKKTTFERPTTWYFDPIAKFTGTIKGIVNNVYVEPFKG